MSEEKSENNLENALKKIEKSLGKGSIIRLGDNLEYSDIGSIPSGSIGLNSILGIGGYAKGRIIEIYGMESSGKTTLALQAIAECQKIGGKAAFIDAEHAFDIAYSAGIGVDVSELLLSQPDTGEDALEITEALVSSNEVDIIVIDSVAALVPKAEIEGEFGDAHMGLQARLMSQACRKLAGIVSKTNTCIIFINQIRMKIGVMFGNPETTSGGNALKFYASQRLDIRRISVLKEGEKCIGNRVKVKAVKNKVAPPFGVCEFNIIYGKGIDSFSELIEIGTGISIIERAGSWYSYNGGKIGQGADNVKKYLEEHQDIYDEIKRKVVEKWK